MASLFLPLLPALPPALAAPDNNNAVWNFHTVTSLVGMFTLLRVEVMASICKIYRFAVQMRTQGRRFRNDISSFQHCTYHDVFDHTNILNALLNVCRLKLNILLHTRALNMSCTQSSPVMLPLLLQVKPSAASLWVYSRGLYSGTSITSPFYTAMPHYLWSGGLPILRWWWFTQSEASLP